EHFDRTIKDVHDVNQYLRLPTLGVIPSIATEDHRLIKSKRRKFSGQLSVTNTVPDDGESADTDRVESRMLNGEHADPLRSARNAKPSLSERRYFAAEAYRALRTSVLFSTENQPKTMLITSSEPGEGKTTTVVNTAISLAQLGGSVLIIDSDLRKRC